jgi:hypothetical protein
MKIDKALKRERKQQRSSKPKDFWNTSDEVRKKDAVIKRKRKEKLQKQLED